MRTRLLADFVCCSLALLGGQAGAADDSQGAQLAATCASCHALNGSDEGIPIIAGLDEQRIIDAMLAYRASETPSHVMHAIALSLSDEETRERRRAISPRMADATMKAWTRREFGGLAGASLLATLSPRMARGQSKARVVVIGGGVGGATVARYLASQHPQRST